MHRKIQLDFIPGIHSLFSAAREISQITSVIKATIYAGQEVYMFLVIPLAMKQL